MLLEVDTLTPSKLKNKCWVTNEDLYFICRE